uniref:Uncharacterized protein n=1 Tax=Arundo donax TaxID=35708 RepID=A0A0A9CJC9_ARUDO
MYIVTNLTLAVTILSIKKIINCNYESCQDTIHWHCFFQ